MSIWKELYEIYGRERARWQQVDAGKQALVFEIQGNLKFLADALQAGLAQQDIVAALEQKQFNQALSQGFDFNLLNPKKVTATTTGGVKEFKKYIGKDSSYLVKNAYLKIGSLVKLSAASNTPNLSLKLKSLFRFMLLLAVHLEGRGLSLNK